MSKYLKKGNEVHFVTHLLDDASFRSGYDSSAVRQFFELLQHDTVGGITEVRILSTRIHQKARERTAPAMNTVVGYYEGDHLAKAADDIAQYDGQTQIYVTLNPVRRDLLARAANHLIPNARIAASDKDILCRMWLPVDVDPKRPSGISSTDAELRAAIERCNDIATELNGYGAQVIKGMSGNGGHLLVRLPNLPNCDESKNLVQDVLSDLARYHNDTAVTIDTGVSNASRVWKVYGTLAVKGDSTAERPHRRAILEFPERWPAPFDLKRVPVEVPDMLSETTVMANDTSTMSQGVMPNRVRTFVQGALQRAQARLEATPEGQKHMALLRAAHNMGGFLHTGEISEEEIECGLLAPIITRVADERLARRTIAQGIKRGRELPHDMEKIMTSPTPVFLRSSIAVGNGSFYKNSSESTAEAEKKKSQADLLVDIGLEAQLFKTPEGERYGTVDVSGREETHRLNSSGFRDWLTALYFERHRKAASSQGLQTAINTLSARAYTTGTINEVHTRIAVTREVMYLDLADEHCHKVKITAEGWEVTKKAPVKFIRSKGMLALPVPISGGSCNELRRFVNVAGDEDLRMVQAWVLSVFQPTGARPVLNITGEQGSAKSSTTRRIRELVDPNQAGTRSTPKDIRDLMISAKNSAVIAFDNLSGLPVWLSDSLCSLATGQGHSTKANYTDDEEIIIQARRPVIVNGISDTGTRPDFLDRCLMVTLPRISETERREEREIDEEFREAHPRLLGAFLDAVVIGLKNLESTKLEYKPRMADFAVWITACAPALGWGPQMFLDTYRKNREEATVTVLESSALVQVMCDWIQKCKGKKWQGHTRDLCKELNDVAAQQGKRDTDWPGTPESLGKALLRIAPTLRNLQIEISSKKTNSGKKWTITVGGGCDPEPPLKPSLSDHHPSLNPQPSREPSPVRSNPGRAETGKGPKSDSCDGYLPYFSLLEKDERKRRRTKIRKQIDYIEKKPSQLSQWSRLMLLPQLLSEQGRPFCWMH